MITPIAQGVALPLRFAEVDWLAASSAGTSDPGMVNALASGEPVFPLEVGRTTVSANASITVVGPASLLIDRAEFGRKAAAEIMSYAAFQDNWDHEGAVAPRTDAIVDALRMLEDTPAEAGPPKAMLLASGDIALYWDRGDTYAEIGFGGRGTYYAYARGPGRDPVHLDDVQLYNENDQCTFPAAVLEVLSWAPLPAAA